MSASVPIIDPKKDRQLQLQNELVSRMQTLMANYVEIQGLTRLEVIGALQAVLTSMTFQTIEIKKA